jgi:hypothetical protein
VQGWWRGKTHNIQAHAYKGRSFTLTSSESGVEITCNQLKINGGVILGSNAGEPGKASQITEFSGCKLEAGNGAPNCELSNGGTELSSIITTNQIISEQVLSVENSKGGKQLLEEFRPANPANGFVKLNFLGTGCIVREATLSGSTVAEVLLATASEGKIELGQTAVETTSMLLKFPNPGITQVWLISNGSGKIQKINETSFVQAGTSLVLLANGSFAPSNEEWCE